MKNFIFFAIFCGFFGDVFGKYNGNATFYNEDKSSNKKDTSCGLKNNYTNYTRVSVSYDQYYNGVMCGNCIEGTINNEIPFKAIVDDLCSECQFGDLDIRMGLNETLPITWNSVKCPSEKIEISTENSSEYFGRIHIEKGGKIKYVKVNGVEAYRRFDNSWEIDDPTGQLGCGPKIEISFFDRPKMTKCLDNKLFGGYCREDGVKCNGY